MIREEFIDVATAVITFCQSRDPYFPTTADALILGWAESFQDSGLEPIDIMIGVKHAYADAKEGFRPLPSTIVQHARTAYFEALKGLSEEERDLMDDVNHALQDLGFIPPAAHRYSRQFALGRQPDFTLTAEQQQALRSYFAQRKALKEAPRRNVIPMLKPFRRPESDAS